jgi:hypothetical protein
LEAENAFRHAAGVAGEGAAKVDALKAEIERRIPYVDVTSLQKCALSLLEANTIDVAKFDGVVFALGAPTLELMLNELLWQRAPTNAVFTWLEPQGIGGHSVLARSRKANARGCVSCLFAPTIPGDPVRNRADFAAPGQSFAQDHLGCGGRYTMFSALDARRTADLASELLLEVISGSVEGHPLRSWKGSAKDFLAAGYRLSPRYGLSSEALAETRDYAQAGCTVCGGTR